MRNAQDELAEIKSIMERSSRFLSLSGLSGILAGVYALIGSGIAYSLIYYPKPPYGKALSLTNPEYVISNVMITGLSVLLLSVFTAWLLSRKKSKKTKVSLWAPASRRFMRALFIPVIIGGLLCIGLYAQGQEHLVAAITLIFYGLGLFNASNFTLNEIKYLSYCQLILGLIATFFPEYGLILWTLGFGVLHIIYGAIMYVKYDG